MKCGYNYSQTPFSAAPSQASLPDLSDAPTRSKKTASAAGVLLLLGFFVIIAMVGVAAFAGFLFYRQQQSSQSYERFSNTSSQPVYTTQPDASSQKSEPQNHQIVNQAFSLKASEFLSYKFTIPQSAGSATVAGNFVASGGGNDIYVVITNEAGVTNIKNGNAYKAYYNSGKVTTDDIRVNLAPGTYYIVFSNAHSLMTPKAVNANIGVVY